MVLGLREQDVNVVTHGMDFDQWRIVVLEDAGDVGVELATASRRAGVGGGPSP